eukprot:Blabericola_migrator_1__13464@NODE_972_length_5858_cov_185_613711_g674_i0_p2_GENE_NODE_972_length_5858_cov_185_613711_g674_i0NODE_972_length_5858_cov_185_613711_g674_i0_p2_ORF_typecomplete_len158_score16_61DUF2824/PF11039_8/6_1e03DUF2824/PF11039_8/6_2DUF2824/PF11039_8/3_2e02DUF2824/PF11039_8/2_9e02_NODE_972_length_5858_cov_185_613711_g674_i052125685
MAVLRSLVFLTWFPCCCHSAHLPCTDNFNFWRCSYGRKYPHSASNTHVYIPTQRLRFTEVFPQVSDQTPTGRPKNLEQERTVITQVPDDAPTTRVIIQVPNDAPTTHTTRVITQVPDGAPTTHSTRVITQVPDDALTNVAAYYTTVFVFLRGHQHLI